MKLRVSFSTNLAIISTVLGSSFASRHSFNPIEANVESPPCAEFQNLVFDLTTGVTDASLEALRYRVLADELAVTGLLVKENRLEVTVPHRQLKEAKHGRKVKRALGVSDTCKDLEERISDVFGLKEVLSSENARVEGLNDGLNSSAFELISRNSLLERDNSVLTAENSALLAERDNLSVQIVDLGSHIDDLSAMLESQAILNAQLDASTEELTRQIAILEAANAEYANQNEMLAGHIAELEDQTLALEEQNDIFAGLNQELNATVQNLEEQVDRFEAEVDDLALQNDQLKGTVDELRNQTDRLSQINDELEANVEALRAEVDSFANKTAELEGINQGLETIASFLNETAGDMDETYQSLTEHLAEQINAYRGIAMETLNNIYIQRVSLWDCSYRDHFADEPFAFDEDLEIPDDKFDAVMDYIEERVLKQLCLTRNDFEHYIFEVFEEPLFTSSHFVSGINSYTTLVLNYYFPDAGEVGGLTDEDWAVAGFACEGLPNEKRFLYSH